MGLLEKILGIYTPEIPQPPSMTSVLPTAVSNVIQKGNLPVLNVNAIVLKKGEKCHYVEQSCLVTKKIEKVYEKRNNGMSFKVMKGMYYHTGGGQSHPVEYEIPVYTKGYLYITNQRVMFASSQKGFDKSLNKLSAIIPYTDAIGLQFGDAIHNVMLPSAQEAYQVLKILGL